ncbi:MAG: hypothetical protein ACYSWP_06100, partial [Planctomycetota bacterium]
MHRNIICRRVIITAVLVFSCSAAKARDINLSKATIVASGPAVVHTKAAQLLQEEISNRCAIRLAVTKYFPKTSAMKIILGTKEILGDTLTLPTGLKIPSKAEGFAIWVQTKESPAVYLIGRDDRGVLFAAGRLIRLLNFDEKKLTIESDTRVSTAPQYPIRGHQLAYRSSNNATDAWNLTAYEQYIRDLILFGTNSIELIPSLKPEHKSGRVMDKTVWDMTADLSQLLDSYGLDLWLWLYLKKLTGSDSTDTIEKTLDKRKEMFKSLKGLDAVMVPGGDGGNSPHEVMVPWLEKLAPVLKETHPSATLWFSNQCYGPVHAHQN